MRTLIACLLISFLLAPVNAQTQSRNDVTYRFANLTAEHGFDLYRNDRNAFFAIAPGTVTAERVIDSAEPQIFLLFPENASPENTPPVAELTMQFEPNDDFVLVARRDAEKTVLEVYPRDSSSIATHRARLHVIHAAENTPDVSITGQNGDVLINRAAYTTPVQADIPSGNYQINILHADNPDETLAQLSLAAEAGTHHTLLIYGTEENIRVQHIVTRLEQSGLFRFVHAAPQTGAVDVYLDGIKIFENVDYRDTTNYAEVALNLNGSTTEYTLALYENGADPSAATPLLLTDLTISARFAITGVIEQKSDLRLITHADDLQQMSDGTARVRFINTAFNLPLLTVTDENDKPIIDPVAYPESSAHHSIPGGWRSLIFRETQGKQIYRLQNFNFAANHFYTFVLAGDASVEADLLILDWNWKD